MNSKKGVVRNEKSKNIFGSLPKSVGRKNET
jgi:hypothetical protein